MSSSQATSPGVRLKNLDQGAADLAPSVESPTATLPAHAEMSSQPSSRPGRRIDREYLRQRREVQIAAFLESATRAFEDDQDFEKAQKAIDQATILNPNDSRVLAFWDRLDTVRQVQVDALLRDARRHVQERSLETAAECIDRAIELQPDSETALHLRSNVQARLNTGRWMVSRTAWRIVSGVVVMTVLLTAAALSLILSSRTAPDAAVGRLLASAQEAMNAARYEDAVALVTEVLQVDPENAGAAAGVAGATAALETERREAVETLDAPTHARLDANQSASSVQDDVLAGAFTAESNANLSEAGLGGGAIASREGLERVVDAEDLRLEPANAAGRAGLAEAERQAAPPAPPPPPAPTVHVTLCGEDSICGLLTVRVEPAATILFNGVLVGTAAQGVLRLPAGRHQIRLESEEYQFRRIVSIAVDTPARLEVNLEDDGLPRRPQ